MDSGNSNVLDENRLYYDAKIIKHSISELGNEIVTWEATIPKWMVAEFNTPKVEIERNSASSRAVPTSVVIDMVEEQPCIPLWRYNEKGMSANEPLTMEDAKYATEVWLELRDLVIEKIKKLQKLPSGRSVAKGTANRPLEWIMWTKVVVTFTAGGRIGLNNFFGLRDKPDAQPEFGLVAHMMHEQYHASVPVSREWHLPYVDDVLYEEMFELGYLDVEIALASSAMCGRVTHYRQGQTYTHEENINRGMSFIQNGHFSPLRHACHGEDNKWYGNFYGWNPVSKITMKHDFITQCCERGVAY